MAREELLCVVDRDGARLVRFAEQPDGSWINVQDFHLEGGGVLDLAPILDGGS